MAVNSVPGFRTVVPPPSSSTFTPASSATNAPAASGPGALPAPPTPARPTVIPAQSVFNDPPWFTLPLDQGVTFPPQLVSLYPNVLVKDGQFTSRLEHETKWVVDVKQMDQFRDKLDALASDQKLLDATLGVDPNDGHSVWKLVRVDKYFQKNADGTFKKDSSGREITSPMKDTYYDTPDYKLAKAQGAFRFRELEGDKVNNINIKPGPGTRDAIGVATRIEYGLWVQSQVKDNPKLLGDFFASKEHLNPFRFLQGLVPGLQPKDALQPSVRISDDRYKYNLEHESGLGVELSLDDVHATAVDPKLAGKEAHYGQLEMEVDHMQFASNNVTQPTPEEVRKWLTSPEGQNLNNSPRIHVPSDINNPTLKDRPEYKLHTLVTQKIGDYLYGDYRNAPQGAQKAHVASKLLGLI